MVLTAQPFLVIATAFASAALAEGLSWLLVYRNPSYRRLKEELDRNSKKLEAVRQGGGAAAAPAAKAAKSSSKKEKRLEENVKTTTRDLTSTRMKLGAIAAACMFLSFQVVSTAFDGVVVGRLPFHPPGWIANITHRGLLGDNVTECGCADTDTATARRGAHGAQAAAAWAAGAGLERRRLTLCSLLLPLRTAQRVVHVHGVADVFQDEHRKVGGLGAVARRNAHQQPQRSDERTRGKDKVTRGGSAGRRRRRPQCPPCSWGADGSGGGHRAVGMWGGHGAAAAAAEPVTFFAVPCAQRAAKSVCRVHAARLRVRTVNLLHQLSFIRSHRMAHALHTMQQCMCRDKVTPNGSEITG